MKGEKMNIQAIDYRGSIVDGPGLRTVVYVQGCEKHCKGCHNYTTWDPNGGTIYTVEALETEIRKKSLTKRITISGGEPLLQYEELLKLVQQLADFNITVYTGYELEKVPKTLLPQIDYLKVGPFIQRLHSATIPYAGSTNQKFLCIERRVKDDYKNLISTTNK